MSFPDLQSVGRWLDEEAADIPASFYDGLNLGIILSEACVEAPESRGDLFVLGEYTVDMIGSMIVIYYGSFKALFADSDEETIRRQLKDTLRHEFTHHMEHRSGEHALADQDENDMEEYCHQYIKGQDHAS